MLALNINQWSENEKGLYLAVALRGQAQGILGDLSKLRGYPLFLYMHFPAYF
jgi:hypothetical protein